MNENKTDRWSLSLHFVQYFYNNEYNYAMKCSPYEVMFQRKPESLLRKSVLAHDFLNDIGPVYEAITVPYTLKHRHDGENSESISCKKVKLSQSRNGIFVTQ